eukprot:gene23174-biopygen13351
MGRSNRSLLSTGGGSSSGGGRRRQQRWGRSGGGSGSSSAHAGLTRFLRSRAAAVAARCPRTRRSSGAVPRTGRGDPGVDGRSRTQKVPAPGAERRADTSTCTTAQPSCLTEFDRFSAVEPPCSLGVEGGTSLERAEVSDAGCHTNGIQPLSFNSR